MNFNRREKKSFYKKEIALQRTKFIEYTAGVCHFSISILPTAKIFLICCERNGFTYKHILYSANKYHFQWRNKFNSLVGFHLQRAKFTVVRRVRLHRSWGRKFETHSGQKCFSAIFRSILVHMV